MPITVHTYLVEGTSYSQSQRNSTATVRCLVHGVEGGLKEQKFATALQQAGVPALWSALPMNPEIFCLDRIQGAEQADPSVIEILCQYRRPGADDYNVDASPKGVLLSIGSVTSMTSVETNVDASGELLEVTDPATGKTQCGTVMIDVPVTTITMVRRERMTVAKYDGLQDINGTVNGDQITFAPGGLNQYRISQETGLLSINVETQPDDHLTVVVTYEWRVLPRRFGNSRIVGVSNDPWDQVVFARSDVTGRPYAEQPDGSPLQAGTHFKSFEVLERRGHGAVIF